MSKRELIEPTPGDKRYARRDDDGRFSKQIDVGKASAQDRSVVKTEAKPGHGDKGDRRH